MTPDDEVWAELAALRDLFTRDLVQLLEHIVRDFEAWTAARASAAATPEAAMPALSAPEALVRQVHSLAGTAGAFGLGPVSDAARQLEECLEDGATPATAATALGRLREAAHRQGTEADAAA